MRQALLLGVAAMASPAWATSCGMQEAVLREAKLTAWPGFYQRQDAKGLAAFLTEDFRSIGADGTVTLRAKELAWVAANPRTPSDFVYRIASVTCPTRDTAMIIGQGRSTRVQRGVRVAHRYTSSNLFVRQDGRWRAAMSHISGESTTPSSD